MITGSNRGVGRYIWSPGRSGPVVELLPDGVDVRVIEGHVYVDPDGRRWPVTAGTISDGASIPRPLWAIVGSPLTGKYRAAALGHDEAYRAQTASKEDADRMLLDAMRCSGVDEQLAQIIYEGVHLGGAHAYSEDAALLEKERSDA